MKITYDRMGPNEMWDRLRNLKTTELEIRDHLNGPEREWVIGRLVSQRGIRDAFYQDDDSHRLIIEYDADLLSCSDLRELLYSCGLRVELAAVNGSLSHLGVQEMAAAACRRELA